MHEGFMQTSKGKASQRLKNKTRLGETGLVTQGPSSECSESAHNGKMREPAKGSLDERDYI